MVVKEEERDWIWWSHHREGSAAAVLVVEVESRHSVPVRRESRVGGLPAGAAGRRELMMRGSAPERKSGWKPGGKTS